MRPVQSGLQSSMEFFVLIVISLIMDAVGELMSDG